MGCVSKKVRKIVALLAVLVCCMGLMGCDQEAVKSTQDVEIKPSAEVQETVVQTEPVQTHREELVVESVEEEGDSVVVTSSFCQLRYPFAFVDLIQMKERNEEEMSALEFSVLIKNEAYPVFVLQFGEGAGILLGSLLVSGETEERLVYAELYSPDEAALGENVNTYYAAQETFNDIVESLKENPNFKPAQ